MSKALKLKKLMELVAQQAIKGNKQSSSLPLEEGRTIATEALRELIDDFMMKTEMLIDEHYGKIDLEQFKKQWFNSASAFDNQFSNILKNMSTPGIHPQGRR